MRPINISGRGLAVPIISETPTATGMFLRIDDYIHPEFWFYLHIPFERLKRWVEMVEQETAPENKRGGDPADAPEV